MEERAKINPKYKWKLEDIYKTDKDFEQDFIKLEELTKQIPQIKEKLTKSGKDLYQCLKQMEEMEHIASNLYVYARMRKDEDNTIAKSQEMAERAMACNIKLSGALSFVSPMLLTLKSETIEEYIAKEKGLQEYDFMLRHLIRGKKHVLSAKEEKLMSMSAEISSAPKDVFNMLNNADLVFGSIKDEKGARVNLTHGSYIVQMQNENREVRKRAYNTFYKAFKSHANTIATTYFASVKKDCFYAKARKYKSAITKALFSDNVPESLYNNLIKTVHKNLDTMYEYLNIRKEKLNLNKLAMYDIYTPLVFGVDAKYPYDKAMDMVTEGLCVLGSEYTSLLKASRKDGWIDVYETKAKTSGAYSWGVYGVHPYVLLNHREDLDSVFTIAHELGHAMHTYFSNKSNCEAKAGYTIFVAEVASTVNEILLTHYLLNTIKDKAQKKYILNHYLDQFRTTVHRQTMFAEFEQKTHATWEEGTPLTKELLCEMYGSLNAKYYGKDVTSDNTITYEWARIPHFYNAFYVYKYATGFSCAVQIATDILNGKKDAVKNYISFLSAGGTDYPLELLKIANVRLETGEPVNICMQEFKRALGEFSEI